MRTPRLASSTPAEIAETRLLGMMTDLRTELARTDAKASSLLGIAGVVAAVLVTALTGKHLPLLAVAAVSVAIVTFTSTTVVLATILRPQLPPERAPGSYAAWAGDPGTAWNEAHALTYSRIEVLADQVAILASIVDRKYRRLRIAGDVFCAGLVGTVLVAAVYVAASR